jgi:hypothetical protein
MVVSSERAYGEPAKPAGQARVEGSVCGPGDEVVVGARLTPRVFGAECRRPWGEETLSPGDFVFCPEGRAGLHTFSNPGDEPAQILAISAEASRTSSPIPRTGMRGWRPRDPDPELLVKGGDPGIIARFEISKE